MALRAYLGHPLIVFGHHRDVAAGPARLQAIHEGLAEIAAFRWLPIDQIARTNYATRHEGETLHVRLYSRHVRVDIPSGVERLVVELPGHPCPERERVLYGAMDVRPYTPIEVSAEASELRLKSDLEIPTSEGVSQRRRPPRLWPVARRGIAEARDRSITVIDRVTSRQDAA